MKAPQFVAALVVSASAVFAQTQQIPEPIADPAAWISPSEKSYPFEIVDTGALTTTGRQLMIVSTREHGPGTRIQARFRLTDSTKTISLRLPEGLLDSIKIEANKRDMPYQSLIKVWLAEDVKETRQQ